MLAGGDAVLVAVSGGADSIALLHVLALLAGEWKLRLHVLHVDHQLRPGSERDADVVRRLGARLGVPVDTTAVAVARPGSLEAAARHARYQALEIWADRLGASRIAVGHNADDQAETVLMRMLEGGGLRGLAGIPPVRGRIIRPLLETRRSDIVEELRRAGLVWIDDPSNADRQFLRNRIRHRLLPALEAGSPTAVVPALNRVAAAAREAATAIEQLARREMTRLAGDDRGAVILPLGALRDLPLPVGAEVLRQAALAQGVSGPLRGWAHRGLRRALALPPPRRPFGLGRITVDVSTGSLRVGAPAASGLPARAVPVPGHVTLPEAGLTLETVLIPAAALYRVPGGADRVAFDADLLPGPLVVRGRRPGDRFRPFGGRERRLKAFLIDAKVPRWARPRLAIMEAAGEIVWVAGVRRGAAAPVTAGTRTVVEAVLRPLRA
jgi:tRNA(Ile)-lysidine synthase